MNLNAKTKIGDILKEHSFLVDFLPTLSPKFKKLKNPIIRKTLGRTATLDIIAEMGGIKTDILISEIEKEIKKKDRQECKKHI